MSGIYVIVDEREEYSVMRYQHYMPSDIIFECAFYYLKSYKLKNSHKNIKGSFLC